ncbi:DUF5130 family protein [Nocardioides sp. zg-536]|uniref:DUF5130 family protein n=1 Tax=Nocardioides faecalis TaxID=2803858 RepID=A0A938YAA8_9ACTN|nr:DUF5130 family protein [Nocardioides faecalis]MBM9460725.1 DUF5130 family protein [Nocardioides faecalis]MBS4752664.1 DUF5130 family protein [Nocardioides faecalis]QVI57928.1 DUF5130 family protein [Nocardioides faecalis]
MSTPSSLTEAQRAALDVAIRKAEQACRAEISVYVGATTGDARAYATSLHNTLVLPSRSVLVMVDPFQRVVQIVTGGHVRERLTDEESAQAVAVMTEHFERGDLGGGLQQGIELLGELAQS